ncbi:MAG: signal peptidase II [Bacteroidetes bacterium]|nr:signal peptidase II [Bacteroidota bacterium]
MVASVLLILDQVTKWLAGVYLPLGEIFLPKMFGIVGLKLSLNRGLIFGFGTNATSFRWVVFAGNIAITCIIVLWYYAIRRKRIQTSLLTVAFGFGIAAGLGNAIDAIVLGYVRDFITWFGPGTFNLSDLSACIASILLLLGIRDSRRCNSLK